MDITLLAGGLVFGLVIGSFLNVVIFRLPTMLESRWTQDCCELLEMEPQQESTPTGTFNLIVPGSTCPHCGHKIRPWENIPLLSYLFLKGKCASCKASISPRYPLVELTTGVLSAAVAFHFGYSEQALAVLILTWSLIALTMIDIDHQLLPDQITLPLLWAGLLVNAQGIFVDLTDAVYGAVAGYLILWTVFWLFKLITGKEGMGFGDFKLLAALGAWMGWQSLPIIVLMSSLVGAVIGIAGILILGRDRNIPIPFGPYLAIAGWITLLWGDKITRLYLQITGLA
ncbi:MAG: A24 family peptidase [Exilibacterium sp.]